jgi:hypothetical protein
MRWLADRVLHKSVGPEGAQKLQDFRSFGKFAGGNMNCKVVAVILAILALALMASIAHADSITDTNTTTDGTSATVNAGEGETFLCSLDAGSFSCTDPDQFTCYGWANCTALNATSGWALSETGSPYQIEISSVETSVPEPSTALLMLALLPVLFVARKKLSKFTPPRTAEG